MRKKRKYITESPHHHDSRKVKETVDQALGGQLEETVRALYYDEGRSTYYIAKRLGVSRATVQRWMKGWGMEFRGTGTYSWELRRKGEAHTPLPGNPSAALYQNYAEEQP